MGRRASCPIPAAFLVAQYAITSAAAVECEETNNLKRGTSESAFEPLAAATAAPATTPTSSAAGTAASFLTAVLQYLTMRGT